MGSGCKTSDDDTGDALAVALGVFLDAFLQYEKRHEAEFAHGFDTDEIRLTETGVENLDKAWGVG